MFPGFSHCLVRGFPMNPHVFMHLPHGPMVVPRGGWRRPDHGFLLLQNLFSGGRSRRREPRRGATKSLWPVVVRMQHDLLYWLVVLEHDFHFSIYCWDVILPIDELIFFKMGEKPPTWFNVIESWLSIYEPMHQDECFWWFNLHSTDQTPGVIDMF